MTETYSDPEQYPDYQDPGEVECPDCEGSGEIDWGDDVTHDWIECPMCGGQGTI